MLRLVFKTAQDDCSETIEAAAFTLKEGRLEASPERRLIAHHVAEHWYVNSRRFIQFECRSRVVCTIGSEGSAAEEHGPFDRMTCVDGVLWGDTHQLAVLKRNVWQSRFTGRACTQIHLAGA